MLYRDISKNGNVMYMNGSGYLLLRLKHVGYKVSFMHELATSANSRDTVDHKGLFTDTRCRCCHDMVRFDASNTSFWDYPERQYECSTQATRG